MHLAGADEIYLLGGVQAVAAMAVGTETIEPVDMLAGPGNAYVAEAKRQLFGEVGIDLLAGPTEILVIADDARRPVLVAVDLLSQAEHGPDSPAILVTTSAELAAAGGRAHRPAAARDADRGLRRARLAGLRAGHRRRRAWTRRSRWPTRIASEHVEVLTEQPRQALAEMRNYGALFLGAGTCVSYGDKVIGTNHVLPTRRAARYTGGLWVGKYLKTVTYQEITDPVSSARLGEICGRAARVESFEGHARSGDIRAAALDGARPEWARTRQRLHAVSSSVAGRTALVTGAGRGLGRVIARALATSGARVILVGRTESTLAGTAASIGDDQRSRVCPADVSDPGAVTALAAAPARRGHLDPGQQRRDRRCGEAAHRHRTRRVGRGLRGQRAEHLPDVPGLLAGHDRGR